jgi:hypothetical protein
MTAEGGSLPRKGDPDEPEPTGAAVALVLFHGRADRWWLRLLKPGFRHCLVALRQGDLWLLMDPRLDRTELRAIRWRAGIDPIVWFADKGFVAVPLRLFPGRGRVAPPAATTCVESVKRVLGLRAFTVLTPWQLFQKITQLPKT